jgi:hypothetical protein
MQYTDAMHACTYCKLTAQGYTGSCKQLLRLNIAVQRSVIVSILVSAAVVTASTCPSINVCIIQMLCMLVVAVV